MTARDAVLRRNDDLLGRLVAAAEGSVRAGRYRSAAEWAWIAARFATTNPTLRLRSAALERAIDRIAEDALAPSSRPPMAPDGRRRVLHVLTESYEIGGLSRLVQRWIRRDAESRSSVVVTRHDEPVAALQAVAEASGGGGHGLGAARDALERAQRLRRLAQDADYVLCHLNPDDHVAALAFGAGYDGPPVAVFNHSDHMFLLAPTRAGLIVDFREVGSAVTAAARGYRPSTRHTLPLLVPDAHGSARSRDETRAEWGIGADQVVAVTVARAVKFADTPIAPRFSELLDRALAENPRLVVVAVGATAADEPWDRLTRRHPGRIHAVGATADPQPYLDAADLYLDPFPFSSLTSLLEASATALPVLTYDGHCGLRRVLGVADFTADVADRPADPEAYLARVSQLVSDPGLRRARGARAREAFLALTPEQQWLDRLSGLYRALDRAAGGALGASDESRPIAAVADLNRAILGMEARTLLLLYVTGGLPRFDSRDHRRLRARIMMVRALRKLVAGGRSRAFERLLVPAGRRAPGAVRRMAPGAVRRRTAPRGSVRVVTALERNAS